MYYRRCESCGSKALATATRCPRCELAFELNDVHGQRHRLVPCRKCKVVHPAEISTCRWCGEVRASRTAFPNKTIGIASGAVAAAALMFATRGAVIPVVQSSVTSMSSTTAEFFSTVERRDSLRDARDVTGRGSARPITLSPQSSNVVAVPATFDSLPPDASATMSVEDVELEYKDDVGAAASWEEVKAITWVNVRADRHRDATILAVLNPDDIVRLGDRHSGWRRVHVAGATGWVDGRHFTPSSRQ